jgi:hypothetical protein
MHVTDMNMKKITYGVEYKPRYESTVRIGLALACPTPGGV